MKTIKFINIKDLRMNIYLYYSNIESLENFEDRIHNCFTHSMYRHNKRKIHLKFKSQKEI